ncbi:MAG: PPC domain-containing protein [Deltaproteobacteria bacterium]|nr:PPC domain-containing protein [Deltaproteobacteria bacterium]
MSRRRRASIAALLFAGVACSDNLPPTILETTVLTNTADTVGPYVVTSVVSDSDGVSKVELLFSVNGANPGTVEMRGQGNDIFSGGIPGHAQGSLIAYYVRATDTRGGISVDPPGAPAGAFLFQVLGQNLARVCTTDSQCSRGEVCDRASHRCRPRAATCVRDEDCGVDERCDMAAHACVPRDRRCTRSTDCLTGEVCDPTSSLCVEAPPACGADGTCPSGFVCDRATSMCLRFRCTSDNECSTGERCDPATEKCVARPCATNIDCGSCHVCDPGTRSCLACPVGQACNANVCQPTTDCTVTGCAAPTPVCDPSDKACVECVSNADCQTGAPRICDRAQRKCVLAPICARDSDCPPTEKCDVATSTCVPRPAECDDTRPCPAPKVCDGTTGLCKDRACANDSQCPTGYVCDDATKVCVVLVGCRGDQDCPGKRCKTSTKACVECLTTQDCARGRLCDQTTNTCVGMPGCSTDADCGDPAKPHCDATTRGCFACVTNSHCPPGKVCSAAKECGDPPPLPPLCKVCATNSDCGSGLCAFSDGRRTFCTAGCFTDNDCGAAGYKCVQGAGGARFCEPTSGQCAVACTSDTDCKSDETCTNGQCELRTGRGLCEPCSDNSECGGANDNCLSNGREQFCGRACSAGNACPAGYSCLPQPGGGGRQCFPNTLECPRACVNASDCRTGETCTNGQCVPSAPPKGLCETCASNAECGTGNACIPYPNGSACGRDCATSSCPSGYFCARFQGIRQCVRSNFSCDGVVTPDAGTPPIDAGLPPFDAGTPPDDAGLPPPVDAGTPPPEDAGPPPPPCTEDAYDPNDSVGAAKPLAVGYFPNLCALNDDFYSIAMDGTQGLRVEAFFTNAQGNLDLELIGPDGTTILAASRGQGNGEAVSVNTLAAGTYTVRVYGRAGAQNKYSLQLSYVFIPQCIDDRREPNDTAQTATPIRSGLQAGLQRRRSPTPRATSTSLCLHQPAQRRKVRRTRTSSACRFPIPKRATTSSAFRAETARKTATR